MKILLVATACMLLSLPVFAADKLIVVAHDAANIPVSNAVDIDAEYMATELILSSTADSSPQRALLTRELIAAIRLQATKDLDFEFQVGDFSSLPVDSSVVNVGTGEKKGEAPVYYLLTNLGPEEDIHTATNDVHEFLKQVKVPEKTSIKVGIMGLAISSPENYRDQLLHNLRREIEKTQKLMGDSVGVSISGLEHPVSVRRKNDKKVTLFLDYKMTVRL